MGLQWTWKVGDLNPAALDKSLNLCGRNSKINRNGWSKRIQHLDSYLDKLWREGSYLLQKHLEFNFFFFLNVAEEISMSGLNARIQSLKRLLSPPTGTLLIREEAGKSPCILSLQEKWPKGKNNFCQVPLHCWSKLANISVNICLLPLLPIRSVLLSTLHILHRTLINNFWKRNASCLC